MNWSIRGGIMKGLACLTRWIICLLLFCNLSAGFAHAFLFEIVPVDRAAIEKMTDKKLVDMYIDVLVELEAVNVFYQNTGIAPKEYGKYKALLRFRTDLFIEMQKRELKIPIIK
jgi:hypothetical protein